MFSFSQPINPAVRSHLDAQMNYFNELSKSLSDSFQNVCKLNLQLGQSMIEEGAMATQRMLTTDQPKDVFGAMAARAQPTAEKLRAYQQQVSRLAADAQIELARVGQDHVQETTRTAQALGDEVKRVVAEETERNARQQEENLKNFRNPFQAEGKDGASKANGHTQSDTRETGSTMQVDGDAHGGAVHGSIKSSNQPPNQQPGKNSGKAG